MENAERKKGGESPPKKFGRVGSARAFYWQQDGWPKFAFDRAALRDELGVFARAFRDVKASLATPPEPEDVAQTLTDEAVTTSAIEGVHVDSAVVMSSLFEPEDPINDPITGNLEEAVLGVVKASPGINRERLALKVERSAETVKRGIAALVAAGMIVHRGSKKTGGYYPL